MALTNERADEVVESILTGLGLTEPQAEIARFRWRVAVRAIYAGIKADAVVKVPVGELDVGLQSYTVPPGGALATTGPLAPTELDGSLE